LDTEKRLELAESPSWQDGAEIEVDAAELLLFVMARRRESDDVES
jgi:hypothetical protein